LNRPVRISIIIVNWNSGQQLSECLDSIKNFGGRCVDEIIVVDNASSDGSDLPATQHTGVRLIASPQNLGFAKACNQGAHQATSGYLLFLNPDTRLLPGAIDTAFGFMESREGGQVGICGIRLVDPDGETHRHCACFPTWRTYLGHTLGLSHVLPTLFPPLFMTGFDHRTSREVDHVIGAFFLVRRQVFEQLGGFDERFFVYLEDLDFSLRAKRAGWRSWYLADAAAYHKGGGSSERIKARRLFYALRSRILYAFKHFSRLAAWSVLGLTLGIEPISRLLKCAWRRSSEEARDTVSGYCLLWRDIPNVMRIALKDR
jgi:GT2 family glycosyltransferase